MPEVEKKSSNNKAAQSTEATEETKSLPPLNPVVEIKSNLAFIDRAVTTLEPRFIHRVLRTLTSLRKRIDDNVLRTVIEEVYPKGHLHRCLDMQSLNP